MTTQTQLTIQFPTQTLTDLKQQLDQLKQKRALLANYDVKKVYETSFKRELKTSVSLYLKQYKKSLESAKYFAFIDSVFQVVLTKILNEAEANKILDKFRTCAKNDAFKSMVGVYLSYKDNLEMRNLITFCSALYRWKYYVLNKNSNTFAYYQCKSRFKSELKYASACESCGQLAFNAAVLFKQLGFVDDL